MAITSWSLGEHWEVFIKNEVLSGRYTSASDVIRDALRNFENQKCKLESLRLQFREDNIQEEKGGSVIDCSIDKNNQGLDIK